MICTLSACSLPGKISFFNEWFGGQQSPRHTCRRNETGPIWWADVVIVSITDSERVVFEKKKIIITRQAFHLPLGQIKSVGRAAFVMCASSYFLSAEWLQAILQEFIIYQAGWYPSRQDGSGLSLTPPGSPPSQEGQSGCISRLCNYRITSATFIRAGPAHDDRWNVGRCARHPHMQTDSYLFPSFFFFFTRNSDGDGAFAGILQAWQNEVTVKIRQAVTRFKSLCVTNITMHNNA